MVRRGFPQARAVKGLFSVCNEANTGDSRQAKSFLPRPCSAVEVGRAESTDIPQGSGDKNQRGPRDEWGAWGGMQMIFSNNKNKKTKKGENPGSLQLLLLKAIGFQRGSWALWDTLAGCSQKNCCTGPPCWEGSSMRRCSTRLEPSGSFHQPLGRFYVPKG